MMFCWRSFFLAQNYEFLLYFDAPYFSGRKVADHKKRCWPPKIPKIITTKKNYLAFWQKLTSKFKKIDPPFWAKGGEIRPYFWFLLGMQKQFLRSLFFFFFHPRFFFKLLQIKPWMKWNIVCKKKFEKQRIAAS